MKAHLENDASGLRQETFVPPAKHMFSGASFFDVIDSVSRATTRPLSEPTSVPQRPAIVAFYGFRGGAGRTIALAHVAIMLAQRGLRVAALDFDLEAPGLHIALGTEDLGDGAGLVPLLRNSLTARAQENVSTAGHLQVVAPKEGVGKVLLIPAGKVTRTYLAQIEELGVGLWHEPRRSPLERIIEGLIKDEDPDVVFIDCRTGFSGMSASVLFHLSDLAVIFLPLSDQVLDGVDVLLQAVAAARIQRENKPGLLFIPSMVPPGEAGKDKVKWYGNILRDKYERLLHIRQTRGLDDEEGDESGDFGEAWLEAGVTWDPRISADGSARQPFLPGGPWGIFQPLCDKIIESLDLETERRPVELIHAKGVLDELQIRGSDGFAEELDDEQMQRIMVPSDSVRAAVDRSSALVIGAKGSGKTLLWRFLIEEKREATVQLPSDTKYIVGHAPKQELDPQGLTISPDGFKEMEQLGGMQEAVTYKAFWLLYGLFRLSRAGNDIAGWLSQNMPRPLRAEWKQMVASGRTPDFAPLLKESRISTMAEDLWTALDSRLANEQQHYVLVFDGLDSGFQTGKPEAWYRRRERFVTGLLQVVAEWRSRLRRLQFKVFLREDIYLSAELQNRSHLDAAKHELRFGPSDLWQLALKIATTSSTYRTAVAFSKTGPDGLYIGDETELKALLYPLWGRTVEKGKRAYTANYILKRTSDAQGRLFPRTFIQMLDKAIDEEKKQGPRSEGDRVLRFRSLREGVIAASGQRVTDLRTEYVELKPYLEALRGAPSVATPEKLIAKMKPNIGKPALSLHMGPGGWRKVLDRLITVGVMGKKAGDPREEEKLSVALLYRDGLGVKGTGLK
jgi:MinD-like ATPase involved in chromosome partitioning or flagellar assembly